MTSEEQNRGWAALKGLLFRGSALEILGYGSSQAIRLGSNLILTRLMFPEAFGLMAIVYVLVDGLVMLSDVGIEQAVIQNERGDDERFLNTAWSFHAVRGLILWGIASLLAWPAAQFYDEPQLLTLIPVGALVVAIQGLQSTSVFTLRRRVKVGKIMAIDVGSQVASVLVMIPFALIQPTVWALVAGGITGALFRVGASHVIEVGYKNRFEWDPSAKAGIVHFGKWIFGSSAVNFFCRQGDRLLLGKFLGVALLGIYSIAVILSEAASIVVSRIARGVLMPVFSHVRHDGTEALRDVYYRVKVRLDAVMMPAIGSLAMIGQPIIDLLYDDRYAEAGWMLQMLSIRVGMSAMLSPCESCLMALGHTRYSFYQNLVRAIWIVAGMPIGWQVGGMEGLVLAVATSELPAFVVLWVPFRRLGLLRISREAFAVGMFGAGVLLGAGLLAVLPGY